MIQNYLLPPHVQIYYITNSGIAYLTTETIDTKTQGKDKTHPTYHSFGWTDGKKKEISLMAGQLSTKTDHGKKSVIAIFEDRTIKQFINVENEFVPSLQNK